MLPADVRRGGWERNGVRAPPLSDVPLLAAVLLAVVVAGLVAEGCSGEETGPGAAGAVEGPRRVRMVTTIAPLRNIVENVGGDRVAVVALVPEGTNAHTYEPPPSAAREITEADLIVVNGLNLELPTLELAEANAREDVEVLRLGDKAIPPADYVFDFSFPASAGNPNPHLWTAPHLVIRYGELVREALSRLDPEGAAYYGANTARYVAQLERLDTAFFAVALTIPEENRKLLTYHDSFPYFGPRYGFEIIGAVQPSDFSDPSPREVAALVEQIRAAGVPAIFGSAVFSSAVLETIAEEAGAVQVATLRDDDLPGEQGDADNTLVAMLVANMRTLATVLGGDASALDGLGVGNIWAPFAEFGG